MELHLISNFTNPMCNFLKLNLINISAKTKSKTWCIECYLKCCFNSGLLMTPCKPITNKSNQFSFCSWPFTPEADWANRRLTDRLNDCPFHSCIDYPFCGDCLILWWINLRLRLVMVISDGFWMAVCLFSDLIPAFSFTTVIVLDFLNLKIS